MHSEVHKFNVQLVAQIRHSLIPLDVNASPYEKRKRKREQEKGGRCSVVLELTPQILIRVSSPCYRFNTFKSDCTLRLHVQPLRPTATNQDQDGEKEGGWVSGLLLEENQSSSLRNRLSSEGNREYNKQEEFKRAEREEAIASKSTAAPPHPRSCNPLRNRCTDLPFRKYIPSKGDGFAEKAASERTPLEFIRAYDR